MDGLYVDTQHRLQIVVCARADDEWTVFYNGDDTAPIKLLAHAPDRIVMRADGVERIAEETTDECISWSDGDRWHKIDVSYEQWQLMTRRPYVPVTLLMVSLVYDAYLVLLGWLRHLVSRVKCA